MWVLVYRNTFAPVLEDKTSWTNKIYHLKELCRGCKYGSMDQYMHLEGCLKGLALFHYCVHTKINDFAKKVTYELLASRYLHHGILICYREDGTTEYIYFKGDFEYMKGAPQHSVIEIGDYSSEKIDHCFQNLIKADEERDTAGYPVSFTPFLYHFNKDYPGSVVEDFEIAGVDPYGHYNLRSKIFELYQKYEWITLHQEHLRLEISQD